VSPRRRSDAGGGATAVGAERDQIRRGYLGLALCHELKQPLHSLNLNLELLGKRLAKVPAAELGDIDGPIQALGRVVDRINDCLDNFASRSMPDAAPGEPIDLLPVLDQAVERVRDRARRAGVKVVLRASDLPPIPVNPEHMAVAIDALLDNAIRASASGGEVLLSGIHADDDVRVEVSDRGTGMTPEVARHAPEIGYSTWGGTGIGLTVAKFITYHHAGGFQVATTPGQGTTVAMILPATDLRE
jgi:signal transduction histidine kinase